MPFALLVDTFIKALRFLNWKRLLQLSVLLVIIGLSYAVWENRRAIYSSLSVGKMEDAVIQFPLSEKTKDLIKTIVNEKSNVVAVQVVQTDFRENTRHSVDFYSEIDELMRDQLIFTRTRISSSPLLIAGDSANNERVIAIMEQEFVCTPVPPSVAEGMPSTATHVKQLCAISVPPTYGKMGGYVTVWMKEEISKQAIPEYKRLARVISPEVYKRDVLKDVE